MNTYRKGISLALLTALVSGVSIFVNKFAVGIVTPPLVFTATKNAMVGLTILIVLLASGKWRKFSKIDRQDKLSLLWVGLIGGALPFYLFFTGISQIPAINAALIHKTLVIWVALLAAPFLKERLSRMQITGIALLFVSNLIVGGFEGFTFSMGELLVLIATMLWAIENVVAKRILSRVDPDLVTFARMGIGSILLLGASVVLEPAALGKVFWLDLSQWGLMLTTAGALLLYVAVWYRALQAAPATTVAAVLVVSTLITNTLSAAFITHTWNLALLLPQAGLALTGLVVYLGATRKDRILNPSEVRI